MNTTGSHVDGDTGTPTAIAILQRIVVGDLPLVPANIDTLPSSASSPPTIDCGDPRWFELFVDCFLLPLEPIHDDLLFFVRQQQRQQQQQQQVGSLRIKQRRVSPARPSISSLSSAFFLGALGDALSNDDDQQPPVFVKRRKDRTALDQPIPEHSDEQDAVEEDELHHDFGVQWDRLPAAAQHRVHSAALQLMPPLDDLVDWMRTFWINLIVQLEYTMTVSVVVHGQGVVHTRRKRVYATPYEQAMNPHVRPRAGSVQSVQSSESAATSGGSGMACAYPLVYFCIDDCLDADDEPTLPSDADAEYCVQVAARIPKRDVVALDRAAAMSPDVPTAVQPPARTEEQGEQNRPVTVFPLRPDEYRIVLFQGAAKASSIQHVYRSRKESAATAATPLASASTPLSDLFSSIAGSGLLRRMTSRQPPANPRRDRRKSSVAQTAMAEPEYIAMRGPGGAGTAQVAVYARGQAALTTTDVPVLACSLSFVNIGWASIANALVTWTRVATGVDSPAPEPSASTAEPIEAPPGE
ncbi:hypothetical protein RI367_003356 [Sorochytrium milnesiophthora]